LKREARKRKLFAARPGFRYRSTLCPRTHLPSLTPSRATNDSYRLSLFSSGLVEGASDSVHISSSDSGDDSSAEVGLLEDLASFESLESLSDEVSVGDVEVVWGNTSVSGSTVHLSEGTNTGVSAHVQVSGEGGASDVEPVGIIGSQLFVGGGLDDVSPLGDLDFAGVLKELGEGLDELLLVDVLDTNGRHCLNRIQNC